MIRKLLLVDDEKPLLELLEESLSDCRDSFETFTCTSVDQAIALSKDHAFDLIVTDIKMPGKSGIELLMHLKSINFQGKMMVMTAYGNEDIYSKVNELGGIKIIAKPFDFDWFKDLLLDYFNERKGFSGTIESIDLTSLLQLINLERKNVAVKIDMGDQHGFLHFEDGEIINAEFADLQGEEAAIKLINLNSGKFKVIKKKRTKKNIKMPFINFMMETMRLIDEERNRQAAGSGDLLEEEVLRFTVNEGLFLPLIEVSGFRNAAVYNQHGDLVVEQVANRDDMRDWGIFGLNIYLEAVDIVQRMGSKNLHFIHLQTEKYIYLYCSLLPGKAYLMVVLDAKGNLGVLKNKLKSVVEAAEDLITFPSLAQQEV
jgi:CheY-like chemotaxis protein